MELRCLMCYIPILGAGCAAGLKPGEYLRGSQDFQEVDSELSIAYRHENQGLLVAIVAADSNQVNLAFVSPESVTSDGTRGSRWEDSWFHHCDRSEQRFVCKASPDGPVLIGTINTKDNFTLYGSGDPTGSWNTKEFADEFAGCDSCLLDDNEWNALNSDFDTWLNQ